MGVILKKLSDSTPIRTKGLWHHVTRVEKCETGDIHLHWRNLRVLMTKEQFNSFSKMIATAAESLKDDNLQPNKWGNVLLGETDIPDPTLDGDSISVEAVKRDLTPQPDWPKDHDPKGAYKIHFHYKDLRLEFEPDEYWHLDNTMSRAVENAHKANL